MVKSKVSNRDKDCLCNEARSQGLCRYVGKVIASKRYLSAGNKRLV